MQVHCPQCGKHYRVESRSSSLLEEQHFICTACQFEFSVGGARSIPKKLAVATIEFCPFCEHPVTDPSVECRHCLKIPMKYAALSEQPKKCDLDPLQKRLSDAWQDVIEDFASPESHQNFIGLCRKLGNLDFAEERYRRLLDLIGDDPEIEKRLQQIEYARFQSKALGSTEEEIQTESQTLKTWRRKGMLTVLAACLVLIGGLGVGFRPFLAVGVFIFAGLFLNSIKK